MAAGNKTLGFAVRIANEAGDALDEVKDDLDRVEKAAAEAGKEVKGFGEKLGATAEAGGNAEQALRGVGDLAGVAAEQFGVNLGPMDQYVGALGEVGGGIESLLKGAPAFLGSMGAMASATWAQVTALYAQAVAFVVANAPIIAIVAAVALLTGGIVLLVKHWDTITEKVPILGTAVDKVKDVVITAKDLLIGALTSVPDWLKEHWPEVAVLISGPFAPIVLLATDAFGVRSALTGAFKGAMDDITGLAGAALDAGKNFGGALKDGILDGLKGIVSNVADIAGAFQDALKAAINSALLWAHQHISISIPGFDPPGPGSIPGFDWNFPLIQLATGGIVTRPTLALIGEAGPEAVVPLSWPNAPGQLGGGHTVIIQALDALSFRQWLNGNPAAVDDIVYTLDRALKRAGQPGLAA